jgi:ankyrin repeat protein
LVVAFLFSFPTYVAASDVDALYEAAGAGDTAQVIAPLDSGVDVNARTSDESFALNKAAVVNQVDVMRVLLERGADPNVQNGQGDTPLVCATKFAGGKRETVQILIDAGTDLALSDHEGKTALDYAKAQGQRDAVVLLEKRGKLQVFRTTARCCLHARSCAICAQSGFLGVPRWYVGVEQRGPPRRLMEPLVNALTRSCLLANRPRYGACRAVQTDASSW